MGSARERRAAAAAGSLALRKAAMLLQGALAEHLLRWMAANLVTQGDALAFNPKNQLVVAALETEVAVFLTREGRSTIADILRRIRHLFELNRKYFVTFGRLPGQVERSMLETIFIQLGYNPNTRNLIPGGYLHKLFSASQVSASVAQNMSAALAGRMPLKTFQATFRQNFAAAGPLFRHFDYFARDLFISYDRAIQNQYAEEMDLEYAVYAGTIMKETRCFCERRVKNLYSKEELLSWNSESWKGKIKGGDVLINLGGFNCRHHLSWIPPAMVKGYIASRGLNKYNQVSCSEHNS